MEEHKRPWPSTLKIVEQDPEPELSKKDRRLLEADIKYWKDASKRKDNVITDRDNTIKGLRGHITRLQATLKRKGVYKS